MSIVQRTRHFASAPFIYAVLIPIVFLDVTVEVYHRTCFPLYGLSVVDRSQYVRIDRHKLQRLSVVQKIHCAYCGYVNGVLAYIVRIAADTERYWCAIQHQQGGGYVAPSHHADFEQYNG